MRCIDSRSTCAALAGLTLLAACSPPPIAPGGSPASAQPPLAAPVPPPRADALPAPSVARSWNELRLQAGRRLLDANPNGTYVGQVPEVLLAIPVLEIELNADGSIRRIDVMRVPGQARDTTQLAIDAVRRAAPFGDVSRLPKPWKFTETFLFNDERKFKPRSLD